MSRVIQQQYDEGREPWNKQKTAKNESRILAGSRHPRGMKGKKHSKKTRRRMSLSHIGEKNVMYGKHHTEETREKIRMSLKEIRKTDPDFRLRCYAAGGIAALKSTWKRPTRLEKRFIDFIDKYNLPIDYVGNGSFVLGGKNPDFKHRYKHILYETANSLFKVKLGPYKSLKGYIMARKEHFGEYGYEVILIAPEDLDNETKLIKKIGEFRRFQELMVAT